MGAGGERDREREETAWEPDDPFSLLSTQEGPKCKTYNLKIPPKHSQIHGGQSTSAKTLPWGVMD